MPSSTLTFRRGLIATVILLLVLALLPHRYSGYATIVRSVTVTALSLVASPVNSLASSLRRQEERPVLGELEQLSERILILQGEVVALQERERHLVRTVQELENLRRRLGESYEYRRASVVGRSGETTLQVNLGSVHGLSEGTAAVERASVVGRISQVGPTSSTLSLVTTPETLLEVVTIPAGDDFDQRRSRLLLEPVHANLLMATEVDRQLPIEVGDYARLMDERWPRAVQGMIVGQVVAVEPDPDDGLLKRVAVRPLTSLPDLDEATIIVPRVVDEEITDSGGGGGS